MILYNSASFRNMSFACRRSCLGDCECILYSHNSEAREIWYVRIYFASSREPPFEGRQPVLRVSCPEIFTQIHSKYQTLTQTQNVSFCGNLVRKDVPTFCKPLTSPICHTCKSSYSKASLVMQSPKGDISYLTKFFLLYVGGRVPLHLREDFCGTALIWSGLNVSTTRLLCFVFFHYSSSRSGS